MWSSGRVQSVEVRADPGDLALGYPGVRAEGFDEVVDGAGGDAVDVCLHDDRVESLVDAPPTLEEAGEEASGPQFRDGEFQVASLRGHRLLAVPRTRALNRGDPLHHTAGRHRRTGAGGQDRSLPATIR